MTDACELDTGLLRDDEIESVTGGSDVFGSDVFMFMMEYQRMLNAEGRDDRKAERSGFHPFQLRTQH